MFVPQGGQQRKGTKSAISSQDTSPQARSGDEKIVKQQPREFLMWPNRSDAGQTQRGGSGLDITIENTPRYAGPVQYSERNISTLDSEETNYRLSSALSSITIERKGTSSELSNLTDMRLASLPVQGKTAVSSPKPTCKGDAPNPRKDSSQDTTASLTTSPIFTSNPGSVTGGSSDDVLAGKSEALDPIIEDGHGTPDMEKHIGKSVPLGEGMQSISYMSQPEVPLNVLELSIEALKLEDTGSKGSLIQGTVSDSSGEQLAGRDLVMPLQSLEQLNTAHVSIPPSKWGDGFTACASHEGSSSISTVRPKSKIVSIGKASSSSYGHKRTLDNLEDHSTDGEDDTPERPNSGVSVTQDLKSPIRLACPFVKHDPEKYNPTDYHKCATTPWPSISRLKEHLFRAHMAPTYCGSCKQTPEDLAAIESQGACPDVEMSGFCECQDVSEPAGTITSVMAGELKKRWRNATVREKWERIYCILFPNEAIPTPFLDAVQANPIQPSQTQRTPSLEKLSWRELGCALKICFNRSAHGYLKTLPDNIKAEIAKDILQELQLTLSKSSPDRTPRIRAHHIQHHFEGQSLPVDKRTTELPIPIESEDFSGAESSNQGLGLTLPSSESLHSSPREGSFTGPDLPRCKCKGNKCECPPWPTIYFDEQYMISKGSDMNRWSDINDDLVGGNSDPRMF